MSRFHIACIFSFVSGATFSYLGSTFPYEEGVVSFFLARLIPEAYAVPGIRPFVFNGLISLSLSGFLPPLICRKHFLVQPMLFLFGLACRLMVMPGTTGIHGAAPFFLLVVPTVLIPLIPACAAGVVAAFLIERARAILARQAPS